MSTEIVATGELTGDLQLIDRLARDPNVPMDRVERAWQLRMAIVKEMARVEFFAAMARCQQQMPRISKKGKIVVPAKAKPDGSVSAGHATPYALYEDIDTAIRPIIEEEGFSESYSAEPATNGASIWHCLVSHRMGHQERYSTPPMPPDETGSKNKVQAVGSSNAYARRYLRCNIWNIITIGVDDDGKSTGYLNDKQIAEVCRLQNEAEIFPGDGRAKKFLAWAQADSIPHIQQGKYEACVQMLRQAAAKKEGAQ